MQRRIPLPGRTALVLVALAIPDARLTLIDPRLILGVSVWTKPLKFLFSVAMYLGTLVWFYCLLRDEARQWRGARVALMVTPAGAMACISVSTTVLRPGAMSPSMARYPRRSGMAWSGSKDDTPCYANWPYDGCPYSTFPGA